VKLRAQQYKKLFGDILALVGLIALFYAPIKSSGNPVFSPLQATDILSLTQIPFGALRSVAISPDGRHVAYVTVTPLSTGWNRTTFDLRGQTGGHMQLWIESFSGKSAIRIGPSEANNWDPVWSPDGNTLAFYSNPSDQSYVAFADLTTGKAQITRVATSPLADMQWAPDGTHILVAGESNYIDASTDERVREPSTPSPLITVLSSDGNRRNKLSDTFISHKPEAERKAVNLVLVNAATGAVTTIAYDVKPTRYVLSPDGTKVLYTIDPKDRWISFPTMIPCR